MALSISASVGLRGINRAEDVGTVQSLLNTKFASKIEVDQMCGPKTIHAIREFQRGFLSSPDGRVDPGGLTWQKLVSGQIAFVLLPQLSGMGYYSYSEAQRQYGTPNTIRSIQDIAGTLQRNMRNFPVGIGDISCRQGGPMSPHTTHQHGTNVDVRPLRKDNQQAPVTITDPQYGRQHTEMLVQSFLAHSNVKRILFNDTSIHGVHYFQGHHNHMHVEMKS